MDVKEFEALKKKHSDLQLMKAREEAKLEELEKKLEENKQALAAMGITDLEDLPTLLEQKEKELQEQYDHLSSLLTQFEQL